MSLLQGLLPTTYMDKNSLSVKTDFKLNDKWTVGANVNFNTTFTSGEFNDGYSNQTTGSFNQWFHRNLDMDIMKELRGMRTPEWHLWQLEPQEPCSLQCCRREAVLCR
jgi:hypothetical protein